MGVVPQLLAKEVPQEGNLPYGHLWGQVSAIGMIRDVPGI